MDFGLKGKRAIVTGGSGGIGCASAMELAREGAKVCVTARGGRLLESVVGGLLFLIVAYRSMRVRP